jgi:hypothetical protein
VTEPFKAPKMSQEKQFTVSETVSLNSGGLDDRPLDRRGDHYLRMVRARRYQNKIVSCSRTEEGEGTPVAWKHDRCPD